MPPELARNRRHRVAGTSDRQLQDGAQPGRIVLQPDRAAVQACDRRDETEP